MKPYIVIVTGEDGSVREAHVRSSQEKANEHAVEKLVLMSYGWIHESRMPEKRVEWLDVLQTDGVVTGRGFVLTVIEAESVL